MKHQSERLNIWLLLLVAVIAVFLFQRDALFVQFEHYHDSPDVIGIRSGYEYAKIHGTSHWWTGTWINQFYNYYRPVSSYLHYTQMVVFDNYGMLPITVATMLIYALLAAAAGLIAYLLSSRTLISYLTTVFVGGWWLDGRFDWLSYYPYLDNIAAVLFQLLTIVCFLLFVKHEQKWWVLPAWGFLIISGLCKEIGWATPALLLVISSMSDSKGELRRAGITHAVLMGMASAAILLYGRSQVGALSIPPGHVIPFLTTFLTPVWLIILAAVTVSSVVFYVKFRHPTPAKILICILILMLPSAVINVDALGPRFIFLLPFAGVLVSTCMVMGAELFLSSKVREPEPT